MVVGVCRIVLSIPGNGSLKGKRKVVRRVLDRVRHRFNAAAAEVEDMDIYQRAVLGMSVVSNDHSHANAMIDEITSFISSVSEALVIDRQLELIHVGAEEGLR